MKEVILLDFDGTLATRYHAVAAQLGLAGAAAPAARETPVESAEDIIPRIYSVVRDLYERNVRIAVTSEWPARVAEAVTRDLAIDMCLAGVYGSDSVGERKPHPAIVQRALTDLAVRAEVVLFVGDMLIDVEMAHAAGLQVAVVVGAATRTQCVKEAPDHVLYDWMQVPDLFRSI